MATIVPYEPVHADGVYRCMLVLLSNERKFEELQGTPSQIAGDCLKYLHYRCETDRGIFLVALQDEQVVGFLSLWREKPGPEAISDPHEFYYISDLVVLPEYRGKGIGRALVEKAEVFASEHGIAVMKVSVLARNSASLQVYRALGFRDYDILLVKKVPTKPGA